MDPDIIDRSAEVADLDKMSANARRASDFLKAIAHENRLMILCLLYEGEKSVTELENSLGVRQPTVSQQLARLRADGLVATRRDGKAIYYRLAGRDVRTIIDALYEIFCDERNDADGVDMAGGRSERATS